MTEKKDDPTRDPKVVRRMAELMMQGAVMLAETCPLDGLPLFRLKNGDIICPVHGKIILVHDEAEAENIKIDSILHATEKYAAGQVERLLETGPPEEIVKWLEVIEKIENIKKLRSLPQRPSESQREEKK